MMDSDNESYHNECEFCYPDDTCHLTGVFHSNPIEKTCYMTA